ncbi:MAG: prephenate/arogenate dehydrogenase family protein [Alphaproteobacteria bacterium]|nr:prephenate/arogenate dehydrogenase family protein [Alphaproteobacteria bacterium]
MTDTALSKVAIIGIGLIGASIALAARHHKSESRIALYDRDEAVRKTAQDLNIGDEICADSAACVADADLVILAVPVGAMKAVKNEIKDHLKQGAIITDTGSTKRSVIRDIGPLIPNTCHLVAGHPLAGTEFSGPEAGFPSLFDGRYWLIIPGEAPQEKVSQLEQFLSALGAMTEQMGADYHDRILALTSHLPHLIAYTIVGTATDLEQDLKNDVIRFSASGFRDFTRIAASDPVMWRDVFINNDEAILEMLQRFNEDLSYLQRAIRWKEGDKLFELFSQTRDIRRSIIDAGQDS